MGHRQLLQCSNISPVSADKVAAIAVPADRELIAEDDRNFSGNCILLPDIGHVVKSRRPPGRLDPIGTQLPFRGTLKKLEILSWAIQGT